VRPVVVSEEALIQPVSFPDADDIPGLPRDPFAIKAKTEDGDEVRPAVVIAMLNREMARKIERRLRKTARSKGLPEPIVMRQKLSDRETNERMADMVIEEWERYHQYFPLRTLQQYLDERTGSILEEAILQGKPLDRAAVRQALANLHEEAKRRRKEKS
jgi:hypothetical protein